MEKKNGWWFPDKESHLPKWLEAVKKKKQSVILNNREAYQGKKQVAAMAACKQFRNAIDIGGHVGLWSFNLSHKFKHVDAFEPMQAHRDCFAKNVLATRSNVTLHACALGSTEGSVSMVTEKTSSGDTRVGGEGDIPMKTLDSFNLNDVDLIKIDCEGYELFVIKGGVETIRRCRPTIIVEQKPGHGGAYGLSDTAAVSFLKDMGYVLKAEMAGDYILTC
jgi:FkbM family methyltransferase